MSGDPAMTTTPGARTISLSLPAAAAGPRAYDIVVGQGVLAELGSRASRLVSSRKALLVVDDQLPGETVRVALESLDKAGIEVTQAPLRALEVNKTLATVERLLVEAEQARLERGDVVIALGGGITGDVAGFVASSFKRGVPVIQCPTTLLAMVDASVGGKTGVNLESHGGSLRKNMVGAFWQPRLVLADTRSLLSLEDRELSAGIAECLKHGMLSGGIDPDLGAWTRQEIGRIRSRELGVIDELVERNVKVKASIVQEDEREEASSAQGGRALLNLGHTFAHAIETIPTLSPDGDPAHAPLLHGEAVALGLVAASEAARALGHFEADAVDEIRGAVQAMGMRSRIDGLPPNDEIIGAMGSDKKVQGGALRLVVPMGGGQAQVVESPAREVVIAGLEAIRDPHR